MSDSAPHVKRSRDGEKKKDERTPRGLILRKIAPKNQPFSSMSISWLLDLRKDATAKKGVFTYIYKYTSTCSCLQKDYRTMASGWRKGHRVSGVYGRELVSTPATSLKKSSGGASVERVRGASKPCTPGGISKPCTPTQIIVLHLHTPIPPLMIFGLHRLGV